MPGGAHEEGLAVPSPRGGQAMGLDPAGSFARFFPRLEEGPEENGGGGGGRKDSRRQHRLGGLRGAPAVTRSHRLQWGVRVKTGNAPSGLVVWWKVRPPPSSCPSHLGGYKNTVD